MDRSGLIFIRHDEMSIDDFPIIYTGSVKNLRVVEKPSPTEPGIYLFEYTDDYSIFDWGKMPDPLAGKGQAMATLTAFFFEELEAPSTWEELERSSCWQSIPDQEFRDSLVNSPLFSKLQKEGLRTHYRCLRDSQGTPTRISQLREPTNIVEVDAVNIVKPERIEISGRAVWDYTVFRPGMDLFLIPVENVFRYGIPRGSSLLERLEESPDYHLTLGLQEKPKEGDWLPRPILEYFTKLEPQDRHLTLEQSFNYAGLNQHEYIEKDMLVYLVSLYLIDRFARAGIEIWDGKFEFIRMGGLVLADAIGPDELRCVKDGVQISKEPIRQYHKLNQADWYDKTREAKKEDPENWVQICKDRYHSEPEPMDPRFRTLCEHMYQSLTNAVTGTEWFPEALPLHDVIGGLKESGVV
jgi:phosphoribosylaminoimidazole-succinocarboxamide synthase